MYNCDFCGAENIYVDQYIKKHLTGKCTKGYKHQIPNSNDFPIAIDSSTSFELPVSFGFPEPIPEPKPEPYLFPNDQEQSIANILMDLYNSNPNIMDDETAAQILFS